MYFWKNIWPLAIKIICISKESGEHENPYLAISRLGWVDEFVTYKMGNCSREEMFDMILNGTSAFVYEQNSIVRYKLGCAISSDGKKYVKTQVNGSSRDRLLELNECLI